MFGKIIEGKLVIAGNKIKTPFGMIVNPKEKDYLDNGWKILSYQKPITSYNDEEEKIDEVYTEEDYIEKDDNKRIGVVYKKIPLTDKEHNEVIKRKIEAEENKITARNIREAIKGDSFALKKIDEVENKIAELRSRLR